MAMKLILQISDGQKLEIGDPQRVVFGHAGGRIGRALECDWVLSSRYVSRHHATVSCAGGVFYIESLGDNGVALNDSQQRLPKRARRALKNGDRIFLDEYEINVTILDTHAGRRPGRTSPPRLLAPVVSLPVEDGTSAGPLPVADSGYVDSQNSILKYPASLPTVLPQAPGPAPSAGLTEGAPPDTVTPTVPSTTRTKLREDAGLTELLALREPVLVDLDSPITEPSSVVTAPPGRSSPAMAFDVAAFLNGAGVDPLDISSDTSFALGQIVRVSVQGVIDLLRARAQFRNEFRLPITGVQSSYNNPLKSAVEPEQALVMLLRPSLHGYPLPLRAFVDAFDDIRFHQIAMVAGMRAGFDGVTRQFDPKKLIEQFERSGRAGVSRFGSRARYWAEYIDMFESVAAYPDTAFQRLFREEFSDAYQRCLDELKRNPDLAPHSEATSVPLEVE